MAFDFSSEDELTAFFMSNRLSLALVSSVENEFASDLHFGRLRKRA